MDFNINLSAVDEAIRLFNANKFQGNYNSYQIYILKTYSQDSGRFILKIKFCNKKSECEIVYDGEKYHIEFRLIGLGDMEVEQQTKEDYLSKKLKEIY